MTDQIEALRELASVAESCSSVRAGLIEWSEMVSDPVVHRLGCRARLGLPIAKVVEPLDSWPDGRSIARAIEAHTLHGGSLARTVISIVDALEAREQMAHDALVSGSASKLSARLLGALGLILLALMLPRLRWMTPMVPAALWAASALVWIGVAWTKKLLPRPPLSDRPAASVADLAAALLDSGLHPAEAFESACGANDRAVRLVQLGMSWAEALERSSGDEMKPIASALRRACSSGIPAAEALRHVASAVRTSQRRDADIAARRAPIVLVLPLTLCFLPAFGLAIVAPMLGAMSG